MRLEKWRKVCYDTEIWILWSSVSNRGVIIQENELSVDFPDDIQKSFSILKEISLDDIYIQWELIEDGKS